MLNEYFCRIFCQITFPEYLGNVLRRRIFPAIISAEYFRQCITIKIPEWSDSRKEKPLGKSTVHPNGFAYRCQCFEERLGLNS